MRRGILAGMFGVVGFVLVAAMAGCGSGDDSTPADEGVTTDKGHETAPEIDDDAVENPEIEPGEVEEAVDVKPMDAVDVKTDVFVPCTKDDECPVDDTLAPCMKQKCEIGTGKCSPGWDETCCLDNRTTPFLTQDFETGTPADWGWTVKVPTGNKKVTWSVSDARVANGKKSLYFGDPSCHTYYNGVLDASCQPVTPVPTGGEATRVSGTITTKTFDLPVTKGTTVAEWFLYLDSQPMISGLDEGSQPDMFRVFAVMDPGPSENTQELFVSTSIKPTPKTTGGKFVFLSATLDDFKGRTVALRLSFDTLGKDGNFYEGVYVDDLQVFSICNDPKTCVPGDSTCTADGDPCTDDTCQAFTNVKNDTKGWCAHPADPTCVKPECTDSNLANCTTTDPLCHPVACENFKCTTTTKPDCCTSNVPAGFPITFDDGGLDGFTTWTQGGVQTVKWQISDHRASSGGYSLYYGNLATQTYDTPGTRNYGVATSPAVTLDLPAGASNLYAFLSFKVLLSTEFNDVLASQYDNPAGRDLFEVFVMQNLGKTNETSTRVWSSDNVRGTTIDPANPSAGPQFVPVGIDLSDYKSKKVWLRFSFDTSDEISNAYEGVYIDDLAIQTSTCPPEKNCKTANDCGFDGTCKKGDCTQEVCTPDAGWVVPAGCCSTSTDCDDGDQCTFDGCIKTKCYHDYVEGPQCCKEDTFADWEFPAPSSFDQWAPVDSSVPGVDGPVVTWRYSEAKAHSTPGALYFGDAAGTTCDNGGTLNASVTSSEIDVPSFGIITLEFYLYADVAADLASSNFKVEVVPSATEVPFKVFEKSSLTPDVYKTWFQVSGLDLSTWKNTKVKIRITATGAHGAASTGIGLFFDDIKIRKVCP